MSKQIYRQWKWFDRNWNEIEPESKIDFTKPLKIIFWLRWKEYSNSFAKEFWDEIDNHNLKKEQEESKENAENLRNLTKDFLKTNNLV